MVLYPGHPLIGRIASVVRRYGQRERGQWIIELPDGSRQYLPISWCAPLAPSEETLSVSASSPDEPPAESAGGTSPLSLTTLRNLAALVRRLQEEATQREEEQHDAGRAPGEDALQEHTTGRRRQPGDAVRHAGVADVGELPGGGSAPTGAGDPTGSTPPGGGEADEPPSEDVREP
jgi:hypothetical protein